MKAVLTPHDDAQILARYLAGERVQDLADQYGVSTPTIYSRIPVEQRRGRGGSRRTVPPRPAPAAVPAAADDLDDAEVWAKANPAISVTIKPSVGSAFKDAQITYRGPTFGYYPPLCETPQCGTAEPSPDDVLPIAVVDYRSRLGAVVVRFCTWHCLSRHAIRAELAGGDA